MPTNGRRVLQERYARGCKYWAFVGHFRTPLRPGNSTRVIVAVLPARGGDKHGDDGEEYDQSKVFENYGRFFHFAETLVQRQVVPDAVLPAGGRVLVIREMVDDPSVDVFDRQRFDR